MAAFNSIHMIGNVTQDPTLSYTPQQTAVVDFGIAENHKWTDQGGASREDICFVDVRAYGKLAENIDKYVSKGHLIFVDGRLTYETWDTKAEKGKPSVKRSKHRIVAKGVQFLNGKQDG